MYRENRRMNIDLYFYWKLFFAPTMIMALLVTVCAARNLYRHPAADLFNFCAAAGRTRKFRMTW
jgi:hypothetical protein